MSMPPLLPHILHTKIVTFVIFPATPRPVPSKKRQRFILCNSYRGGFAAPPLTASRKQMFIPVHAKRGGFVAMPRHFQLPTGNSRFAGFLPDSKVIQRAEIAGSPVKRAFRGVPTRSPTRSWPPGIVVTRLYEKGSLALSLIRSSGETRAHRSPSARPTFLTVCRLLYSADSFHSASPAEFCSAYVSLVSFSRVERVDRVESIAPIDAKRP